MKDHRILRLFLCFLLAGLLSGCGTRREEASDETIADNPYAGAVSMEETPVIRYTAPRQLPNILVDLKGYCAGDRKVAAVKGKSLPEEFALVDAVTGQEVYRGPVEEIVRHEELDLSSGYLDFSEFGETGAYYLECDIIGRSVLFSIEKGMYAALFEEIYTEVIDSLRQRNLSLWDTIILLEAYEWYGGVFPDGDGDGTPDVLRELRGLISYLEENGTDEADEALYAAFLAKFSYHYQKFDRKYATDCLRRASTVFGQIRAAAGSDADSFFALTELYRATGHYTYRRQIADYKDFFEDNDSCMEKRSYLFAAMTYMAIGQKEVDVKLCNTFMSGVMERAEGISKHYREMIQPVAAKNSGSADLLKGAVNLSCANYVTNNYQYTGIMEDFLHYLMGQNWESACFYEEGEDRGSYLLLLAQMAALHEDEGDSGE